MSDTELMLLLAGLALLLGLVATAVQLARRKRGTDAE